LADERYYVKNCTALKSPIEHPEGETSRWHGFFSTGAWLKLAVLSQAAINGAFLR